MTGEEVLDALVWHSLTTSHARFAEGDGEARRFDPDVAPFAGVSADTPAAWDELAALVGPGGWTLLSGDDATPPAGWRADVLHGHQMVLRGSLPDLAELAGDAVEIVELVAADVPSMLALVESTKPGPFCSRTNELGRYLGVKDGRGTLLAMAGERMRTPDFTEVSAVCTRPDARGRGLAALLSHRIAAGILATGSTPVLHVAEHNAGARRVYERLGFAVRRDIPFVVARPPR